MKRSLSYLILVAIIIGTLLSFTAVKTLKGEWQSYSLHSTMEALGGLFAIVMALFLLQAELEGYNPKIPLIAAGFLGMGLLDIFHSIAIVGKGFILLHSMATLVGGFWFCLFWLPLRYAVPKKWAVGIAYTSALVFGIGVLVSRPSFPLMAVAGRFTPFAITINLLAGIFFIAAAIRLLLDFHGSARQEIYLFACMAILFGLASLMFPFSALWGNIWWLWHIIRLIAYMLVLGYMVHKYQQALSDIRTYLRQCDESRAAMVVAESRLKFFLSATPAVIYAAKPQNYAITFISENVGLVTGYKPEEFIKEPGFWINHIHPQDKEAVSAQQQRLLAEEHFVCEYRFLHKDGAYRWMHNEARLIKRADGSPREIIGYWADITGRKNIEDELQYSYDVQYVTNILLYLSLEDISLKQMLEHALDFILTTPVFVFEPRGAVFIVDRDNPELLVMKAQREVNAAQQAACSSIPFGKCLCGRAALTKSIEFASTLDERHEIRYVGITPHGHYCVPILFSDKVLGVIDVHLKDGSQRKENDENFLITIANTLAGIIKRKYMEEDLNKKIAALEKFQRLTVGRELRIKEMRGQIERLEAQLRQERAKNT